MAEVEFNYSNDEWEIDGAVLSAEYNLTVSAEVTKADGVLGVRLERVSDSRFTAAPVWVSDAIGVWFKDNRQTIIDHYHACPAIAVPIFGRRAA